MAAVQPIGVYGVGPEPLPPPNARRLALTPGQQIVLMVDIAARAVFGAIGAIKNNTCELVRAIKIGLAALPTASRVAQLFRNALPGLNAISIFDAFGYFFGSSSPWIRNDGIGGARVNHFLEPYATGCLAVGDILGIVHFLGEIGAINLAEIAGSLGNIPFLGVAGQFLTLANLGAGLFIVASALFLIDAIKHFNDDPTRGVLDILKWGLSLAGTVAMVAGAATVAQFALIGAAVFGIAVFLYRQREAILPPNSVPIFTVPVQPAPVAEGES